MLTVKLTIQLQRVENGQHVWQHERAGFWAYDWFAKNLSLPFEPQKDDIFWVLVGSASRPFRVIERFWDDRDPEILQLNVERFWVCTIDPRGARHRSILSYEDMIARDSGWIIERSS